MLNFSGFFKLIVIVVAAFGFAAGLFITYNLQREQFDFNSFHVENEIASVYISNLDRLKNKINEGNSLEIQNAPVLLTKAINQLNKNNDFEFAPILGKACWLSYNADGFILVFNTDNLSAEEIVFQMNTHFGTTATSKENEIVIDESTSFKVEYFNHFSVIGNVPFKSKYITDKSNFGNSDYIVFYPENEFGYHHILNEQNHFVVYDSSLVGPIGKPVFHANFLRFIPARFSTLSFYGSNDFQNDEIRFFPNTNEPIFDWVDDGMFLVNKDSFELLIAPQNSETDLKTSLKEETELLISDSTGIQNFNIGPYSVFIFKSNKAWDNSLGLNYGNFNYFVEIENYNVLANSIPAMRWYLGELQLGNLLINNPVIKSNYQTALPLKSHHFSIQQSDGNNLSFSNYVWKDYESCIVSKTINQSLLNQSDEAQLLRKYNLTFVPDQILTLKENLEIRIVVANKTHLTILDTACNILKDLNFSSPLVAEIQIADFENDGNDELVLFQQNQLNVINSSGNSLTGWPKIHNENSSGGIVVNYDNSYNHRLLTNIGNQVKSIDEQGNFVEGWMFTNMTSSLKGNISYYVAQGKDMISFKDINNMQYVINRRGESRVSKPTKVILPNESGFVVGNLEETSLRKLGYRNNHILNYYLFDGQLDSVKLDRSVNAIKSYWIFNNNQPLLVLEEIDRAVVIDEFGYEKKSVLKPDNSVSFSGLIINEQFTFVFVDNSQNNLYLLNEFGKMIFPNPVKGNNVYHLCSDLLLTMNGQTLNIYKIN